MKIAVLNEFSQAPKNNIIVNELKKVVEPMGHEVYNAAMEVPLSTEDVPGCPFLLFWALSAQCAHWALTLSL